MYITCQNCDTTFELDEHLLKPSGSKVRCSQCRHVFVAHPPAPAEPSATTEDSDLLAANSEVSPQEASRETLGGRELEGIDLEELDAMLDDDLAMEEDVASASADAFPEAPAETSDEDLSLAPDEMSSAIEEVGSQTTEDILAGIDLDMDFELDDTGGVDEQKDEVELQTSEDASSDATHDYVEKDEEALFEQGELDDSLDDLDLGDLPLALDESPTAGEETLHQSDSQEEPELTLDFEELSLDRSESGITEPTVSEGQDYSDEFEELALDLGDEGSATGLDELATLIEPSEEEMEELILDDDNYEEISLEPEESSFEALSLISDSDETGISAEGVLEEIKLDEDLEDSSPQISTVPLVDLEPEFELGEGLNDVETIPLTEKGEAKGAPAGDDSLVDLVSDDLDFALSDLESDLGLETDKGKDQAASTATGRSADADEFDFDIDLDGGLQAGEADIPKQTGDLSIGEELTEDEAGNGISADADDLDLSEFDKIFSDDSKIQERDVDVDLTDVDLSLDGDVEPMVEIPQEAADLSFEDGLSGDVETDMHEEETADLDLSDLDNMLSENNVEPFEKTMTGEDGDVSLDEHDMAASAGDETEFISFDDISLDEGPPTEVSDGGTDSLDLPGLNEIVDEAPAVQKEENALDLSLDEEDLSLEDELAESSEEARNERDLVEFDDIDFEEAPAVELSSSEDDIDLSDLDDLVSEAEEAQAQVEDLDLSLEEEDLSLENQEISESPSSADETELITLDDGALADIDDAVSEKAETDDELDFTALDTILGEDLEAAVSSEDMTMLAEESEISLDLEDESEVAKADISTDEELEDLDFKLDAEFEDKPVAKPINVEEPVVESSQEEESDEVDLSDIEEMLESGVAVGKSSDEQETMSGSTEFDLSELEAAIDEADGGAFELESDGEKDLEFDLDMDGGDLSAGEPTPVGTAEATGEATILDSDLDFSLDLEDQEAADHIDGLELKLDLEEEEPVGSQPIADDNELDLSDLRDLVDEPQIETKSEIVDAGDIELEFEIEEKPPVAPVRSASINAAPVAPVAKTADAVTELAMDETITAPLAPPRAPLKTKAKPIKPKKKGASKLLVVVLILVLLGGGGYLGYDYVVKNDIQIPYVSEYLNPRPKDPNGTLNLSTLEISSKFIENEAAGRLFVITGKVHNGYQNTRGMIVLRGKLFAKGKVLVKSETAYAGIVLTDQELASIPIQEIKNQLKATPEPKDIGTLLRPGQTLSFMLVFSDLPDDLDEFAIETVSSKPIQ